MIGVDTNVLVRFFLGDDEAQSARARALINSSSAEQPVFVSVLVLAELVWVLQRFYEVPRSYIFDALNVLATGAHIVIERHDVVTMAIQRASESKVDLADVLIAAIATDAGCDHTVTFDKAAARRVPGMELLA